MKVVQETIPVAIGMVIGLIFLGLLAYGLYYAAQLLRQARVVPDNYEQRITGTGDYPVQIQPNEEVLFDTRSRDLGWKVILLIGITITLVSIGSLILVFFIYWGIALIVYANDRRKESDYLFTTDRLIEVEPDGTIYEYEYDEVKQLQTGRKGYERLLRTGHLEFSTGDAHTLHRITAVRNQSQVAKRLENGISK